jgi:hypothetical protein
MVRLTLTIIFCRYNRKGTSHSSTWWLQRVGSYVAEWDGATTHVWPNDEQFDPQEFDAYLQRYTAATRVRLIQPTDPAEAPPASMHDMYPTQSTTCDTFFSIPPKYLSFTDWVIRSIYYHDFAGSDDNIVTGWHRSVHTFRVQWASSAARAAAVLVEAFRGEATWNLLDYHVQP